MKFLTTFFIIAVLAIASGVADDFQQRLAKAKSECLSEVKVDKTLVDGIKEGKFADDSALKEYIFCVNKKIGYQNENGDFQDDEIRKVLKDKYSEELLNRSITTCNKKKDTPQESAFQALKCALEILEPKH